MLEDYLKPPKEVEKKGPVYVATGSFRYRFKDGSYLRLQEGVAIPDVGPGHLKELKKYKHVKEVT
jgi:hypothetical protein